MRKKLTLLDIQSVIEDEQFYVFPGTAVTVCCLTLRNGYKVIGQSACVNVEMYDREIGERLAQEHAISQIWQLEGYLLRQQHHEAQHG